MQQTACAVRAPPHPRPRCRAGGAARRGARRRNRPADRARRAVGRARPAVKRAATGANAEAITAIVAVTDDGGSSGVLRRDLGVLPPGDIRNCLAALTDRQSVMTELLQYRFAGGEGLAGHSLGNLLLAGLTEMTGDLAQATERLGRILNVRGQVLPATTENVWLRAEFSCGAVVEGETAIVNRRAPIRWMSLTPTGPSAAEGAARGCQRRSRRRRARQPLHERAAAAADGRVRRCDRGIERRLHLRGEPDDRAGRDRRVLGRGSPERAAPARGPRPVRRRDRQ